MPTIIGTIKDSKNQPFTGVVRFNPAGRVRTEGAEILLATAAEANVTNGALSLELRAGRYAVTAVDSGTEVFFVNVPTGSGTLQLADLIEESARPPAVSAWLSLASFGMNPANTPAQNTAAFTAAVNAANDGDTLYLPPGRYQLDPAQTITITKTLHLIGQPGQSILVNGNPNSYSATAFAFAGAVAASAQTTLTQFALPDSRSIKVTSTSGFSVGEWVLIRDDRSLGAWGSPPFDDWNEEIVRIEKIATETLYLHRPLARTYLMNRAARVYKFTAAPPSPLIAGLTFERCRIDLSYCADAVIRDCRALYCDLANFSIRHSVGVRLLDCITESPPTKGTVNVGPAFFIHHSQLCLVRGHVARWCEGAVVRKNSWQNQILGCQFIGANTGLALYTGDCRFNHVADCLFDGAQLQWGNGGHYADSYNTAANCQFRNSPTRAIGAGNTAYDEVAVTWDVRAFKAAEEHGFENGQAIMIGGTPPTGLTAGRRYFAIAPTANAGPWANEFVVSDRPPKPPAIVTVSEADGAFTFPDNWATGDAVIFDEMDIDGIWPNRIYFLRQRSGNSFYLQIRPGQTATFNAANDRVTLTSASGSEWQNGDAIMFTGGTLPAPLVAAPTIYYLRDKSGPDTFKLAATPGGPAIDLTTSGSGTIYALVPPGSTPTVTVLALGGNALALPAGGSGMAVTPCAEGNLHSGHLILNPPTNAVHVYRTSGTVFRGLKFDGAQDATNGMVCFTLGNCTDITIENCTAANGLDAIFNRVAHLAASFNVKFIGGEYLLRNSTGQLFTGSGGAELQIVNLNLPGITSRARLISPGVRPIVTRLTGVNLGSAFRSGDPAAMQLIGDASVASALPGETANILVWATTLTANRTVDLDDQNACPGDWIEIVRTAGGAFSLTVRRKSDAANLYTFTAAPQTGFVRFIWSGSAWVQTAAFKA